ncbi:MAG TPA: fasciclin domain-containing protein [Ohtaekwangia sp.]
MKTNIAISIALSVCIACSTNTKAPEASLVEAVEGGQSTVQDNESQKNIVQVAVSSPDHKTLVAALKAAEYVDALSNAGPFTVFAPSDEAFSKLPAGTVDDLVKPENKEKLRNILEYHVYVGVIRDNMIQDGMSLNQVNGQNIKLSKAGDKIQVNGANVVGVVPTSNGVIYVVDQVLLPPAN